MMTEIRLRSRTSKEYIESVKGKILSSADVDVLLTGTAQVWKPDGKPLCIYLPKAIPEDISTSAYEVLHTIRGQTMNRGFASGGKRATPKLLGEPDPKRAKYRTYAVPVESNVVGVLEGSGSPDYSYCRLTAWTGEHIPQWQALRPYMQAVAQHFAQQVPDRYAAQMRQVEKTRPEWVVPGTPFTTLTVNNTFPTGVHTDKGDLEEGFSCIAVIRRGKYSGGFLTFPEYRVAVNMQDRDLILMDAHEWHGNVTLVKQSPDAERISVVLYYRTNVAECGSYDEELSKAYKLAKVR